MSCGEVCNAQKLSTSEIKRSSSREFSYCVVGSVLRKLRVAAVSRIQQSPVVKVQLHASTTCTALAKGDGYCTAKGHLHLAVIERDGPHHFPRRNKWNYQMLWIEFHAYCVENDVLADWLALSWPPPPHSSPNQCPMKSGIARTPLTCISEVPGSYPSTACSDLAFSMFFF